MKDRAVIYVRTSSEHQGEKSSPTEQESDCRNLAAQLGLTVVDVYRDIEKYRVKNKLVEPSGTRPDRPGLVAMLKDAELGKFDVIIAWREDRLYRGMRSMLVVLEAIQEYKINVKLVKETFDPKIAPLRAWVAQMELDGMKERMTMGVKARLKAGKPNTGQDRYGYLRKGDVIEVVEEEARWVRRIFNWYLADVPIMEIRQRLIEANAPQKGGSRPRKIQWARTSIQAILKSAKEYAYGIKIQSRKGEMFEIPVEPIIDVETYKKFELVRQQKQTHPIHNIKRDYLINGLLYCDCNLKWVARTNKKRRNRKGELVERKTPVALYFCPQLHKEARSPECPRSVSAIQAEATVWEKVCEAIENPAFLVAQAELYVGQLRENIDNLHLDRQRIEKEIKTMQRDRQWIITQARQGKITSSDMQYQLSTLTMQEIDLKRELSSLGQEININALNNWEARVKEYLTDLQVGIQGLKNAVPQTDEERQEVFRLKKRIVNSLVERVTIDRHRNLKVKIRLNLLDIPDKNSDSGIESGSGPSSDAVHFEKVGTYTRKQ